MFDRSTFAGITSSTLATYGSTAPPIWQAFAASASRHVPDGTTRRIGGGTPAVLSTHPDEIAALIIDRL